MPRLPRNNPALEGDETAIEIAEKILKGPLRMIIGDGTTMMQIKPSRLRKLCEALIGIDSSVAVAVPEDVPSPD